MTKQDFNSQVQQHLGSLQGIDETMPACDRPCNVHAATQAKQSHEVAVLCLLAQYTGNGMADEIADKVGVQIKDAAVEAAKEAAKEVASNGSKSIKFSLPGIDRVISVSKVAVSTWFFRLVILPCIFYWLANGKIDRETVRAVVADAMKAQKEQTQPLSKASPTLENTVGMEKPK